ncbi:hypothetical protein Taro_043200 [Colocasia esculenta]|uniref:Uncharacterized protein n=1 Tax=Colocasia esculenta TaxID=4460 RepID=A0A843X117_COLES|nr:hypothetical protein [Colocasia esculenta]
MAIVFSGGSLPPELDWSPLDTLRALHNYTFESVRSLDPYYGARQSCIVHAMGATTAQESQESTR